MSVQRRSLLLYLISYSAFLGTSHASRRHPAPVMGADECDVVSDMHS